VSAFPLSRARLDLGFGQAVEVRDRDGVGVFPGDAATLARAVFEDVFAVRAGHLEPPSSGNADSTDSTPAAWLVERHPAAELNRRLSGWKQKAANGWDLTVLVSRDRSHVVALGYRA
jgi:hypothetical protein